MAAATPPSNGDGRPFDLDAVERDETAEAFPFTVAGQAFTFAHPNDIDWHKATELQLGDPERLLQTLLGDEQYTAFAQIPLPAWKLNALLEVYGRHAGIDMGELAASSSSSATTAARSRPTSSVTTVAGSRTSPPGG